MLLGERIYKKRDKSEVDLGDLFFGWPLNSLDFDANVNDGWRTLFRLYGSSLNDSDAFDLFAHERPYCPLVLCPRLQDGALPKSRVFKCVTEIQRRTLKCYTFLAEPLEIQVCKLHLLPCTSPC